jgi:hypothetical protein
VARQKRLDISGAQSSPPPDEPSGDVGESSPLALRPER